jgi:serine/threonine-protein kinase PknK
VTRGARRAAPALVRAWVVLGRHEEAVAAAILDDDSPALRAGMLEHGGVAKSYLGRPDEARRDLAAAAALYADMNDPRAELRALSFRAFVDYRSGRTAAAAEGYERALALAERCDARDKIVNLAASLGAAHHQLGRWGDALRGYERGLRAAVAIGDRAQEVMIGFNLAKLHGDIGMIDRAQIAAARLVDLATRLGMTFFAAAARAVTGEVAFAAGRLDEAVEAFRAAAAAFGAEGARREEAELWCQLAEAEHARGERGEQSLSRATPIVAELGAADVEARWLFTRGRLADDAAQGRTLLERARERAAEAAQATLAAEIDAELAERWEIAGARQLATRLRDRAIAHWERLVADLPAAYADAFWSHPARRGLIRSEPEGPVLDRRVRRLMAINQKLTATLALEEVVAVAMDAAIELMGAERGFVILTEGEDLSVAVARNLDRERLAEGDLAFSQGVARDVIDRGAPVVTVDAAHDGRFARSESVHAMQLKSIACVPLRSSDRVLGALYLDHRIRSGAFVDRDLDLLMAFADQVAIAIANARLHAELEARTRELVAERERVEVLLRAQARQIDRLEVDLRTRHDALEHRYDYDQIVGRGPLMHEVLRLLDRLVASSVTVLVEGESGTGKELIARALHFQGPRADEPFVTINCGAVPAPLLESELFGHVRGAFTGADQPREGLFVAARAGTLFLDEIGEMPLAMQVKLLRVLQEREVRPVGSTEVRPVAARVVCATNRVLRDEVAAGRFREDLFYRLSVVEVKVPPLRDRVEDLPALAAHLLARLAAEQSRPTPALTPAALRVLVRHDWPGNIRELENVLTKALIMTEGERIGAAAIELPAARREAPKVPASRAEHDALERAQIVGALASHGWNVSRVSRELGIPRATLYRKLARHGLTEPR